MEEINLSKQEVFDQVDINEVLSKGFGDYSKYIIQSRAIPDVRDGLKPVQRRILYSMYKSGLTADKPYRKSARTVGNVIGTLSPHGDSSVYGAMIRMAQEWKMGVPLIDVHGNKGSIDGDSPAAMRYTEGRLQKIVETGFFTGVDKDGVIPKVPNYDDTMMEPQVLPAQFPNVLVNGSSGISAGYATDIPPHNLNEVLKASIHLLDNPDATLDDILQLIPAPDFPTGGVVVNAKELKNVYATGKGKIELRSRYKIDDTSVRNRKLIVVTEIPYEVNKADLVKKMDEIAVSKKVDGLVRVRDESSREGLRIVIECQKDANERVILSYLYKNTDLRKDYNMNLVVIDNNKPKQLGLIEVLNSFNQFRVRTRRKELEYDLKRLKDRVHIVEGFIKLIDILDEVIAVIRNSNGRKGSKDAIKKEFEFTEAQASEIVDLQLYRLSREDKEKYEKDKEKLDRMIGTLEKVLNSKKGVQNNVKKQYEKMIEDFGMKRRTQVVLEAENWEVNKIDVVKEEDVMVCVTEKGYIKRSSLRSYNTSKVNGLVEDDEVVMESEATTKSYLMLFTNENHYMYIPVHEIKDTRWGDEGQFIASLGVDLKEGEEIISAYVIEEEDREKYILIAKSNGLVKRTIVKEHEVTRRYFNFYDVARVRENEKLMGAWLVEDDGFLGFIGKDKRAMYFPISEIAPKGLKTIGMAGIPSKEDDYVEEVVFELNEKDITKPYVKRKRGQAGVKFK